MKSFSKFSWMKNRLLLVFLSTLILIFSLVASPKWGSTDTSKGSSMLKPILRECINLRLRLVLPRLQTEFSELQSANANKCRIGRDVLSDNHSSIMLPLMPMYWLKSSRKWSSKGKKTAIQLKSSSLLSIKGHISLLQKTMMMTMIQEQWKWMINQNLLRKTTEAEKNTTTMGASNNNFSKFLSKVIKTQKRQRCTSKPIRRHSNLFNHTSLSFPHSLLSLLRELLLKKLSIFLQVTKSLKILNRVQS